MVQIMHPSLKVSFQSIRKAILKEAFSPHRALYPFPSACWYTENPDTEAQVISMCYVSVLSQTMDRQARAVTAYGLELPSL